MGADFAHLHVHTEYSLLDGFSRIKRMVQQAKAKGMHHLAITDHGAMYGALDFYKACKAGGINPIIGVEAYLTENMADHSKRFSDDYHHLLILAKNNTGYSNLLKLTTIAHTEGFHLRPRIDKKTLEKYAEGLIVTSSCLSGEIPKMLLKGRSEEAYKTARWYRDVFGEENFYLEIQEHHGTWEDGRPSDQVKLNPLLYEMHRDLGIPLVATNDLHYVDACDAHSHDVLLCIQTGKQLDTPKRMRFDSEEYYLKSPDEMARLFPDLPDALTNTVRIAEMCNVDPFAVKASLPHVPIPANFPSPEEYFRHLCVQGAQERYGQISEQVQRQMDYELGVINEKGYVPYFLVVGDCVGWARNHGIRCLTRGSAAGSLVAYSLGITNVDPLRYQLLFERFLNPERSDMPDIDMDFPDNRRDEVIEYVSEKYGHECVAQMATFMTMAAKNSVRDVARVMGQQTLGDRITRMIPTGPNVTLQGALDQVRDLAELYKESGQAKEIIDEALKLEGSIRGTGVHAAGVLIANEALENFVPLQARDSKDPSKGRVTQYEQSHLEELGLVKYDFLGLSNLSIIGETIKFVKASRGVEIDLEKIPHDEVPGLDEQNAKRQKAFDLLANGETVAVFQLESGPMRAYVQQLKPNCIEDIMAMVALYRPGPMDSIPEFIDAKHGRKKVTYLDPRLSEWLSESYGVIVYQDQVLQIAVNLAGFSWGKVNKFRKALSKKIMHEVEGYKDDFLKGCVKNGVKQDVAEQLFTLIMPFGGYGFNKAHAASYAVVAFYTAYLKANYPAEYMAAALSVMAANPKKVTVLLAECKRMGVIILGPDANKSDRGFQVEGGNVRFGLLAIKNIGDGPINEIIRARNEGGPFTSLGDFCSRINSKAVGKGAVENLIKAGVMDSLGERHQLLASVESALRWGKDQQELARVGQSSLFADLGPVENGFEFQLKKDAPEIARKQLLDWEKEFIGVYTSKHPLEYIAHLFEGKVTHNTADLSAGDEEVDGKQKIRLGGTITDARRITTKKGDMMCMATLEDMYGTIGVTVFPRVFEETSELWKEGETVIITGDVQMRGEEPILLCTKVARVQAVEQEMNKKRYRLWLTLRLSNTKENTDVAVSNDIMKAQDLYRLVQRHPGSDAFEIIVENGHWRARLEPTINNTVEFSSQLQTKLESLLGKECVEVQALA